MQVGLRARHVSGRYKIGLRAGETWPRKQLVPEDRRLLDPEWTTKPAESHFALIV